MSRGERMNKIIPWIWLFYLAFVLDGYECVTPGTCSDLMFVENKREINHGHRNTVKGDDKTGMVLYETISSNDDNNTYFVYVAAICKQGNNYRYNCVTLKTFSTKDELQQKNSEYCHDREVRINAECRLASMRIVNGSLFCEMEPGRYSKPAIAKININTGEIIQAKELTGAKQTTLCLKTRESSWNPQATGEYADVTVHTFVDGTEFWVLYESASDSTKSIVEHLDINDLSSVEKITIDKIDRTSKVIFICGKLYTIESSSTNKFLKISKSIDIYNSQNKMSYTVNLIGSLPVANKNVWIHYNPKLNELFVSIPNSNTFVYSVALCDYPQMDTRNIDLSRIQSTFHWSLSGTEPNHLVDLAQKMTSYFTITNIRELDYTSKLLLVCPLRACSLDIKSQSSQYCRIKSTITILKTYSDYKHITPQKKLLQIHFHMEKILHQENYKSMASNLNVLKTFMSKGFTELKLEVDTLRQNIGEYFTQLADYDRQTAKSDMNLIYKQLKDFKEKTASLSSTFKTKLDVIVIGAVSSASLDLAHKVAKVAFATAAACNPMETMVDTSGAIVNMLETMDAVAKASAQLVRFAKTKKYIPKMQEMQTNFHDRLTLNAQKYKTIKGIVEDAYNGTLSEDKLKNASARFLKEYDSYEPGYLPSNISDVEEMMSAILEEMCEILFGGSTSTSAVVQATFNGIGSCFDTKIDLKNLMAVYRDMYEKQDALFDAFSAAVRASIAKFQAERIKTINNQVDGSTIIWDDVNLRVFTLELFASSEVHRLVLVHEACTLVQYKNAGTMPEFCKRAIINPQGTEYDKVKSYKYDTLMCDQDEIFKYVTIPARIIKTTAGNTTSAIDLPKGTLDLRALYAGEETFFQIPNKQWLIQNGWISPNENPTMIIMKKFELFLPFIQNTSLIQGDVSVDNEIHFNGGNYITPGGPTYDFNVPGKFNYTFRYVQNEFSCLNALSGTLPYGIPGCTQPPKICKLSQGTIDRSIYYPSVYSKWIIKATATGNLIPPEPVQDFPLMAAIAICYVNPTTVGTLTTRKVKKSITYETNSKKRSSVCCASSGKYYDAHNTQDNCQTCPQGTVPKLQGYYCG